MLNNPDCCAIKLSISCCRVESQSAAPLSLARADSSGKGEEGEGREDRSGHQLGVNRRAAVLARRPTLSSVRWR